MMEVDNSDFNSLFHNLEGYTLSDRKKNLYVLLNHASKHITIEQIESSLENLQPKNYQEELFKIEALIYFHKTTKLLDVIRSGNEVFISKVIRQPWFFKEAFTNISEEILVNDFLPKLSFSLRMKVLNKLSTSLNEDQMDKVFDCVLKRYGLFIAGHFLSSCSAKKIEQTLKTNEIKLWPNQIKALFHKDPKLLVLYVDQNKVVARENDKLFSYIAQKNPALFWDLKEKFNVSTSLGRRTTKRIVDLKKEDIINKIEESSKILNKSVMIRRLKGAFPKIYQQVFPKILDDWSLNRTSSLHIRFLKLYPKKLRWSIFAQSFENTYKKSIDLTILKENVVTIFCDKEVQVKWAKVKYEETENIDFIKYYETKESIPLLKQKINLTSQIPERSRLLKLLVSTCAYNDDMVALEGALKYFCFRHRNEDYNVRSGFLRTISTNIKSEKLNETHWKYINEQIELMRVKDEFNYYENANLIQNFLIFLYTNQKPAKDATVEFIKDVIKYNVESFKVKADSAQVEREILLNIINLLPQDPCFTKNQNKFLGILTGDIIGFNKQNSDKRIYFSDFAIFEEVAKKVFEKCDGFDYSDICIIRNILLHNYQYPEKKLFVYNDQNLSQLIFCLYEKSSKHSHLINEALKMIVCRPSRNKIENDILDLYFHKLLSFTGSSKIIEYFTNNEPQIIGYYYNQILEVSKDSPLIKFKTIKKYSHLKLDEKTVTYFKSQLPTTEAAYEKVYLEAFSILMTTVDYVSLVEKDYVPKKDKLDLANKKENEQYQLQCYAVKLLKNILEPYKAVPVLLKFCVGDYLQASLPTLYKIFYLTAENLLLPNIQTLSKRAVSVRKHGLFLACELLEQKEVIYLFKTSAETEKNMSSQKHLLSAALKYLQKNPSDEVFHLFISNMSYIDKNDKEFLETLTDISKIPSHYKPLYVEKAWEFFENLENDNVNVVSYLKSLLGALNKDIISKMNLEFCRAVISKYFLKDKICSIDIFIYYLIAVHDKQIENFEFVFNLLNNFKNEHFIERKTANKLQLVFRFFDMFVNNVRNDNDMVLALKFHQHWEQIFTIKESFDQIVLINLLKFLHESNESSDNFASAVGDYFEHLLTKFGTFTTCLFVHPFQTFFIDNMKIDIYSVVLTLLESRPNNIELRILAYEVIKNIDRNSFTDIISKIEDHLQHSKSEVVQTYYNKYIVNRALEQ